MTLGEVCSAKKIPVEEVREQIEALSQEPDAVDPDWTSSPLSQLIRHILERYHADLREDLPRIDALIEKVESAHSARHSGTLTPLHRTFRDLRGELEPHMEKEEHVLFPHIQDLEDVEEAGRGMLHVAQLRAWAALLVFRRRAPQRDDGRRRRRQAMDGEHQQRAGI